MHSHNQIKKTLCVFVALGNGHALLGTPDITAFKILNLNIDSIQVEIGSCKTNREQETCKVMEGCTNINTVGVIKQTANSQIQSSKLINYFYSSKNTEADKRESDTMTQKFITHMAMCLMVLGALKGHFHYSLNPTASHTKCHQGTWHMHYRNCSKRKWSGYKNRTS